MSVMWVYLMRFGVYVYMLVWCEKKDVCGVLI